MSDLSDPGPAARLGGELRSARLRLGWDLTDLANSLRIRHAYLEAIEAGRMAELPGTTYALGFVRTYAAALGFSGEEVAGRFRAEAMQTSRQPALSFPAPVPQRGVPAGALMLLGLVILACAYAGWFYVSDHHITPAETVPAIPDRLQSQVTQAAPQSPQIASILPATAPPAASPQAPSAQAVAPPATAPALAAPIDTATHPGASPSSVPAPVASTTLPQVPTPPRPGSAAPVAQTPPADTSSPNKPGGLTAAAGPAMPAATPQSGAADGGSRMVIKASADAWVTVKQKNGPAVYNKLMHAGDSWPVPAGASGLTLTTGNAGGTQIDVDGSPVVPLGASGMVRRDLPLDPDMLKTGKLPALARPRARAPAAVAPE